MKSLNSLKIFYVIVLFAFYALPSHAQIISVTAGTDSTVNVTGGEQFADPNDGTKVVSVEIALQLIIITLGITVIAIVLP